jgi:hypothetical protein
MVDRKEESGRGFPTVLLRPDAVKRLRVPALRPGAQQRKVFPFFHGDSSPPLPRTTIISLALLRPYQPTPGTVVPGPCGNRLLDGGGGPFNRQRSFLNPGNPRLQNTSPPLRKNVADEFWSRCQITNQFGRDAPMLNGPFIGGGHGVWRPILVCLPPHRVHSCRARPVVYESNHFTKKKIEWCRKLGGGKYGGFFATSVPF